MNVGFESHPSVDTDNPSQLESCKFLRIGRTHLAYGPPNGRIGENLAFRYIRGESSKQQVWLSRGAILDSGSFGRSVRQTAESRGYVSSRRRRQRRIAELVTLVEQLEQYLTILRSESTTLQSDIQSLGKLNSDFSDLVQQLQHRNTTIDGENLALGEFLPIWSNNQQMSATIAQAISQPSSLNHLTLPDAQTRSLAELLAQQQQLTQNAGMSSLPTQPLISGLDRVSSGTSYPGIGVYPIDSQTLPMPFRSSPGLPTLQQLTPQLPQWDGMVNIPGIDSSSSSEPGQGASLLATPSGSILPDSALLRLNSRAYGQDPQPLAAHLHKSSSVTDESLLSSLQQMSLLSTESTDSGGRLGRASLNLPPMPADVWRGVPQATFEGQQSTWEESQGHPPSTSPPDSSV